MPSRSFTIPADHPSLPGHFPGKPVIAGAILLDRAIEIAELSIGRQISRVILAKFPAPLLPDMPCLINIDIADRGQIHLQCTTAKQTVLSAIVELTQPGETQ
jgi:3-hydroxymyristoyl/3-hydroxydecanoyl-(acyl carrier protein) dehydratase